MPTIKRQTRTMPQMFPPCIGFISHRALSRSSHYIAQTFSKLYHLAALNWKQETSTFGFQDGREDSIPWNEVLSPHYVLSRA